MRISLFVITILFLSLPVLAVDLPEIHAVGALTPYPAEPGKSVDVDIKLSNAGFGGAKNVKATLLVKEPFVLMPGQEATKNIESIWSGESYVISYKLMVDGFAYSNTYTLNLEVKYEGEDGEDYTKILPIDIKVQGTPRLELINIETSPEIVKPGDFVLMYVTLKNVGTGDAHNVIASLNSTATFKTLGSSEIFVEKIDAGTTKTLEFEVAVAGEAESMAYILGLNLEYADESNTQQTPLTKSIGIHVRGEAILEVSISEIEPILVPNGISTVTVDIANIGPANAKFLVVRPKKVSPWIYVDPEEVYIGTIGSDDYDSVDIKVRAGVVEPGVYELPLELAYRNDYNEELVKSEIVNLQVFSKSEAKLYSGVEKGYKYELILLLLVIIAGYWIYRKRKK